MKERERERERERDIQHRMIIVKRGAGQCSREHISSVKLR